MSKKMWKKLSALLLMVVMVLTMNLSVQAAAVKMNKGKSNPVSRPKSYTQGYRNQQKSKMVQLKCKSSKSKQR